ncbi:MAG: response regulator [Longimicrobiales bacterium]
MISETVRFGPARTILVADDDVEERRAFEALLRGAGFAVLLAADGLAALRTAKLTQPDLILMDLRLPGIDGWEAAARLKADPSTREIRVVAISGFDVFSGPTDAFAGFVSKPVPPGLLLTVIERLLPQRGSAASAAAGPPFLARS